MKSPPENSDASRTAIASTKADFRELRANSSATVRELQEFLSQLKGKSPQEMLGVVSSSQLVRATILSIILVAVAIFALTAVPFFFSEKEATAIESTVAEAAPAPSPPATTPAEKKPEEKTPEVKPSDPVAPLGVSEKIVAPPNVNPLEDSGENFLKDLE